MLSREVHLRLWQVGLIMLMFVVLAVGNFIAIVRFQQEQRQIVAVRNRQVESIKAAAEASCRSRHLLARSSELRSELAIQDARHDLTSPLAMLAGATQVIYRTIRVEHRLLALARRADCPAPPNIPTSPHT